MITVTNRFKIVKGGMAQRMAPEFVKRNGLESFRGFKGIEINISTQFEDYDEMNVMMYWETKEDFDAWHVSDHFKQSHKRDVAKIEDDREKKKSPILENTIIIAEVAAELVM